MEPCPTCGKELTYIREYDRWFCYSCGNYAPRGYGTLAGVTPISAGPAMPPKGESHEGHYHCPSCGRELTYIAAYQRYYCYPEGRYAPVDIKPVSWAPAVAAELPKAAPSGAPAPLAAAESTRPAPTVSEEPAPAGPMAEELSAPIPVGEPSPVAQPAASPDTRVVAQEGPNPDDKPTLRRSEVTRAKKAQLMEWCSAYGLDPMGTRTVLRDRLIEYMDDHHLDEAEEVMIEVADAQESAAPAPASEIASEPVAAVSEEPPVTPPEVAPISTEETIVRPVSRQDSAGGKRAAEAIPQEAPPAQPPIAQPAPIPLPTPVTTPKTTPVQVARGPSHAVEVAKALPCPTCGKDLTYIAQYDRLYCYSCGNYAPRGYDKEVRVAREPARPAIVETPKPAAAAAPMRAEVSKVANPCPTCGRELTYVKEYDRYYCYAEGKYAPKRAKNPCPTCGRELTFVPQYGRYYCYAEGKYAPKAYGAPAATVTVVRPTPPAASVAVPQVRVEPVAPAAEVTAPSEAVTAAVTQSESFFARPGFTAILAATGFALLIVQSVFGLMAAAGALTLAPGTTGLEILAVLGLVGTALAMVGVILGLYFRRR